MSESRTFPTLDIVTVHSGLIVSDRGIDAVYELCGYMLGDSLMTHQLPNASRACLGDLERQHPWLRELSPPKGDVAALKAWCADLVESRGAEYEVEPITEPDWVRGNALPDLEQIRNGRPVIAVRAESGEES